MHQIDPAANLEGTPPTIQHDIRGAPTEERYMRIEQLAVLMLANNAGAPKQLKSASQRFY
ncbi:uncharacterized protein G6M90_00g047370 [Metarhizium brunneum]|uniref:Uncharacterized protein n=1 Tax=Metarhizium brunneum TaxID=500148 RepID=A0A7D5YSW6_9HYPO|nr:hypothetical protein G6M90_00g047370 [Metarhizium brunneum]